MATWGDFGIDINAVRGSKGICPKCTHDRKNKRDPSLSVNKEKGVWNCHNCGWKGSLNNFTVREQKKEFKIPESRLQNVGDKMLKFFELRGISNTALLTAKVSESVEWFPADAKNNKPEGKQNTICFNYYRDEKLVNIKFRSNTKQFRMSEGAELIFYNLNCLRQTVKPKFAVIVEGEMDALTLMDCGFSFNVLSVPNGASLGNQRLEYLDNCWEDFEGVAKIVIATDNDNAGIELQKELIRRLGPDRCYTIVYPEGCKDANEVFLKYGKEQVRNMINSGTQVPIEGVLELADFESSLNHIYENGYPKCDVLNWQLDENITWRGGEVTVFTGVPNHGKTPFTLNIAVKLASICGWRFGIFCPENMPAHLIAGILIQIYVGQYLYHHSEKMSKEDFARGKEFVADHFFIVDTDSIRHQAEDLIELAESLVKRIGIKGFIIDPWNNVEHHMGKGENEHIFIGEKLTLIKKSSVKFNILYMIVAHPTKLTPDKSNKTASKLVPVPTPYNISGSSNWYNMPNNIITVYRNFSTGRTEIYIQKVKWFFVGKPGMVEMTFEPRSQRFIPLDEMKPDTPPIPDSPYAGIGGFQTGEQQIVNWHDNN